MPALRRVFVHEGAGLEPVSIDGFPDMPVFGGDTWEDWEISRDLGELGAQYGEPAPRVPRRFSVPEYSSSFLTLHCDHGI